MLQRVQKVVGLAVVLLVSQLGEPQAHAGDSTGAPVAPQVMEPGSAAMPLRSLGAEPVVTVFGASWCSACKSLEKDLRERNVPFNLVDVDQNARAYDAAKRATGKSVVPLTSVGKSEDELTWFVGADADGIEKAYRSAE